MILLCVAAIAMSSSVSDPKGFFVEPASKQGPGVLVLHPWWGLNADVKAYCKKLADEGLVVFAPDLFEGKVVATPEEAEGLVKHFEAEYKKLQAQVLDAAKWLAEKTRTEIGVVGFSFGAFYALNLSNADPEHVRKVVVYYGTGQEDFSKSKASYLGHFAETDPYESKESVDGLKKLLEKAGRAATIHVYPGTGHWFAETSVKSAYNKDAAVLAWKRTVEFLKG